MTSNEKENTSNVISKKEIEVQKKDPGNCILNIYIS
jgi:hypothetical protein